MKQKMKFIGLLLFALMLGACGSGSSDNNSGSNHAPAFDDVYTAVEDAFKEVLKEDSGMSEDEILNGYFIEDLTANDEDQSMTNVVFERMELDPDLLANGQVIGAMMNVNADEIFVLEAKTDDDVAALKESFERELEAQIQTWEQYLPDQYEKVKNNVIETNGKFLLYVTFSDPDNIVDAFQAQFK